MFETNILLIFDIAFFVGCIILILHMFFSSFNHEVRRTIIISSLVYGIFTSVGYVFNHRNSPNYGISAGSSFGGAFGFIAGFYIGYKVCIFARIPDDMAQIELSAASFAISYAFAETFRLIGSTLGNILLAI